MICQRFRDRGPSQQFFLSGSSRMSENALYDLPLKLVPCTPFFCCRERVLLAA